MRHALATTILSSTLAFAWAGGAAAQDSADPIRLAQNDWTGQLITTQIMGEVLQKAGLNVEYTVADYLAQFAGLKTGDLHVAMEIWETTGREALDDGVASGNVENLGETGMLAIEEWWYPSYMAELCPGLPNWEALKDPACAEAFSTPETAPDGRYLGGPVTWGGFDDERVEALGSALPGHPRRHRRGPLRGTGKRLPASGAGAALGLCAALGADQVRGRMGRVPRVHGGMLCRPGLGLEPRPRPRLRQAARADLEGRLGGAEGQVAERPRRHHRLQRDQRRDGRHDLARSISTARRSRR